MWGRLEGGRGGGGGGGGGGGEGFWSGMSTTDSAGTSAVQEDRGVCTTVQYFHSDRKKKKSSSYFKLLSFCSNLFSYSVIFKKGIIIYFCFQVQMCILQQLVPWPPQGINSTTTQTMETSTTHLPHKAAGHGVHTIIIRVSIWSFNCRLSTLSQGSIRRVTFTVIHGWPR